MRIKILMISGENGINADAEMLREKGFLVYTCKEDVINEMVDEIHPNVVFLNPADGSDEKSIDTYNALLDNMTYASYPVVYTLAEDDVYLVNRKRTTTKTTGTVMSDNILDGIKTALIGSKVLHASKRKNIHQPYYPNRA